MSSTACQGPPDGIRIRTEEALARATVSAAALDRCWGLGARGGDELERVGLLSFQQLLDQQTGHRVDQLRDWILAGLDLVIRQMVNPIPRSAATSPSIGLPMAVRSS